MRTIDHIGLVNWKCYRGTHELPLAPKSYAVVARYVDNPRRSNWGGKSSLVAAPPFALFGEHDGALEDDWITVGEKFGKVEIRTSDGYVVTRERHRGKPTRLSLSHPSLAGDMRGDAAQEEIVKVLVGLTPSDFRATCYLPQRQMSRFITAKPADRMEIVTGWIRLAPLLAAEDVHQQAAAKLSWDLSVLLDNVRHAREVEERELSEWGSAEALTAEIAKVEARLKGAEKAADAAREAERVNGVKVAARETVAEYDALVAEGKELRAAYDQQVEDNPAAEATRLAKAAESAAAWVDAADKDVRQKLQLSRGEFDGHCPVADIECPARETINKRKKANDALLAAAKKELESATTAKSSVDEEAQGAGARGRRAERMAGSLETLRARVLHLNPEYVAAKGVDEPGDPEELEAASAAAQGDVVATKLRLGALQRSYGLVVEAQNEQARLAGEAQQVEAKLATEREASIIFGKNGAQRRVAEGAIRQIEAGANAMLSECGISLGVGVRWGREGTGIASTCAACGHPFPKSAKAKVCERCSAERGPNYVNKLDVLLTNRSGGAEDLGGAAFQLSASAWLRRDRQSLWATALIDEPFGQLDEENRTSLSRHLATLLAGRYGFEQALIIAHHSSVLDALPGRIEIVSDNGSSQVRVTA